MIAERFPELLQLTMTEQLQLADELYSMAFGGSAPLTDEQIYAELQKSLAQYEAAPETGVTWEVLKERILASRRG